MPAKRKAVATMAQSATPAKFSFSGLSVEDSEPPKSQRATALGENNVLLPQIKLSAASRTDLPGGSWIGKGRKVTVPASAVSELVSMIRAGADYIGVGSKIGYTDAKGQPVSYESVGAKKDPATGKTSGGRMTILQNGQPFTGNVVVTFAAKKRKGSDKA